MGRVDGRLEERAAMDAEPHDGDPEPAAVDHLHHPVEAAAVARRVAGGALVRSAGQPGARSFEHDLAGGDANGAHLGLQPAHVEAVRRAVRKEPRHDEGAQATSARRCPLRPCQHDEDLGVDVRAEELLAVETPLVAVLHGRGGVGTHVATALPLGEEHPAFPRGVGISAGEAAHDVVAHRLWCVAVHDVGRAVGHAHGADQRRLRLADEVVEGRRDDAGHGTVPGPPVQRRVVVADEVCLVLQPRRMMHDLVGLAAPVVPAL